MAVLSSGLSTMTRDLPPSFATAKLQPRASWRVVERLEAAMRTGGETVETPSPLNLLSSGVATAALSMPPLDLTTYSQLVHHMASLYRCDPAAVAASLATITSSASHLPLALTAPHALSSAALATAAMSACQKPPSLSNDISVTIAGNLNGLSDGQYQKLDHVNRHVNGSQIDLHVSPCASKEVAQKAFENIHNSFQVNTSSEKYKKYKNSVISNHNNNHLKNGGFPQDNDGALDLSTQGLRSLYSSYRRIPLDQLKPKAVEDLWVENDSELSWMDSKVAAYNPAQKLFMCVDCECVGFLSRVAEHWLGAHANLRVFRCPRCPYTSAWSRCVKMHLTRQHNEQCADTTMWKENSTLLEVTRLMQDLRTKVETRIDSSSTLADKRFYCPHCPYATDRRDLYTRHENIHKDDKPFHCYICFKQFNRADHVKKHFVRMHPDTSYDIAKIRKQPGVRGRGSPAVHENTPPPPPTSCKSVSPAQASSAVQIPTDTATVTPISVPKLPSQLEQIQNDDQNSVSLLPLTIQNLRVHNMAMNDYQPPKSPESPDITVDVVTPDPLPFSVAQDTPSSSPATEMLSLCLPGSQANRITITKCSPSSPVMPVTFPLSLPKILPVSLPSSPVKTFEPALIKAHTESPEATRSGKKRPEKAFRCPYCQWSGSDNWCLKRHMNTHIKPFACTMCEYKAARAERLSTHVFKVHNKRICNKCNFLANTQEKLLEHTREHHHNNPYSRRHTCGVCGVTLENQSALQAHLEKVHAPKSSSAATAPCAIPSSVSETLQALLPQAEAHDLTISPVEVLENAKPLLVCPVESCPSRFTDSDALAIHVQKQHIVGNSSRCPHCSYCLTSRETDKDHWLTHHKDVCAACVLVFTSVYGPQLWKKVHARQNSTDTNLDTAMAGVSRKRPAPGSGNDSMASDSDPSAESASTESDHQDSDSERLCKRSRKQSCPKKVIAVVDEENDNDEDDEASDSGHDTKFYQNKRKKTRRCIRCPDRPVFSTHARLRVHRRTRHRTTRLSSALSTDNSKKIETTD
ncbi:Zinc finger C2H2-type [Trinorchestia longiramus]|nr:Zinc finger C2H2-type [Trinorchestia longiramus]